MKKKKIVFSFGRFNPPTTGHLLLASKVKQEAMRRGADHIIFGSSSQDRKKNPLSPRDKLRFMKKVLKGFNVMVDGSIASPFHALDHINKQGYTDVVFVVGGDRVPEFRKQMKKYVGPGKMYKFQNFEVISAGERDPDADDVTGMSASKMRGAAAEGNLDAFQLGIPSGVSTHDVQMLFKKIQKGMGVKPFVAESWFNLDEFNEFLSEQNLKDFDLGGKGIDIPAVNNAVWGTEGLKKKKKKKKKVNIEKIFEISMQSRRKMARNAKRTAKRRARKRKIKEKRKKSEGAIKKKAQKAAIAKVRQKLIKGVNWNDLSFSQRSKIEDKLKTKKKAIARLSKRLLPSARASEKERLKRVRAKMTTNDPAKAIEKFEDINIDFENEIILEYSRSDITQQRQIAKDREKKAKEKEANEKETSRTATTSNPWDDVLIVSTDDGKKELIVKSAYKPDKHTLEVGSIGNENKGKVNKAEASKLELDPDFWRTKTYTELVGWEEEQSKKTSAAAKKVEQPVSGEQPVEEPLTPTQKRTQTNINKAEEIRSKTDAGMAQDEWDRYQQGKEVELNQVTDKMQKKVQKLRGSKPKGKSTYPTDYKKSEDVEAALVNHSNGVWGNDLSVGNVSDKDNAKIQKTITLSQERAEAYGLEEGSVPGRMQTKIDDWTNELDGDEDYEWKVIHAGKNIAGEKKVGVSEYWKIFANKSGPTSKSDMVYERCHKETGKCERFGVSLKMGNARLVSSAPGETASLVNMAMGVMNGGCKEEDTSEKCKSMFSKNAETVKLVKELQKDILSEEGYFRTGLGMGPSKWFTPAGGNYSGPKPDWWYVSGPGAGGNCWECSDKECTSDCEEGLKGKPVELEHWDNSPMAKRDPNIKKNLIKLKQFHADLSEKLNVILNSNDEFADALFAEAATGKCKFCNCCDGSCNCECKTSKVAQYMLQASPDGTNAKMKSLDMCTDEGKNTVRQMRKGAKAEFSFKGNTEEKTVRGYAKELDMDPEELRKLTGKKSLSSKLKLGNGKVYTALQLHTYENFEGFRDFFMLNEQENDAEREKDRQQQFKNIDGDLIKLLDYLNMEVSDVDIDVPEDWGDLEEIEEESNKFTDINIDGKKKKIPLLKIPDDDDDAINLALAPEEEEQLFGEEVQINLEFSKLVQEYTSPEQFKKDGVNEEYKKKNVRRKMLTFTEQTENTNQEIPYEFKDSSTHGMGTFATKDINENDTVGLYYLNLLNENKNAPQFQRTDFCRFTNHSQHIPNVALIKESDGNFYTYATREIQKGEELLVDYFDVYEQIMPSLGSYGEVIPEVLRWTEGYENMEIPPDSFGDLRDELQYFSEINEAVDVVTGVEENISITGHNKKGHVIGGFYVHGGKNDPEIARKIKSIKKNFGRNLHKIEVKKHGQNIQEPEFVTDSVASDMKDKIKDKIDDFKFYTSSSQTKIRKKEKERKKRVRKSNKKIGIIPEGAGDASASASETDANRAAYLKQYGAKPEQRKRRSARTNARNKMIRSGRASVGDGKDLDHRDGNPLNNSSKNLRMVNRSFNRGRDNNKWRKTNEEHGAGEIGTEKLLKRYIKDTPFMKIIKDKNGK